MAFDNISSLWQIYIDVIALMQRRHRRMHNWLARTPRKFDAAQLTLEVGDPE